MFLFLFSATFTTDTKIEIIWDSKQKTPCTSSLSLLLGLESRPQMPRSRNDQEQDLFISW